MIAAITRSIERRLTVGRVTVAAALIASVLGTFGLPQLLKIDERMRDGFGQLYGHDFAMFWSAGRVAIETGPEAPWQRKAFESAFNRYYPDHKTDRDSVRFNYPPVMLLALAPLSHLPVTTAYPLVMAAGFLFMVIALFRIMPAPHTVLWALGMPLLWQSMIYGQWSFWFAGFLAFALMPVAQGRGPAPWACAVFILKPPLAVALPLACLGVPDGVRSALRTVAMCCGLIALSMLVFGLASWQSFVASLSDSQRFLIGGLDDLIMHSTTFGSMVQMLGASASTARTMQLLFTFAILLLTGFIMRAGPRNALKVALIAVACVLAAPYFMIYDFALLVPAVAFYICDAQRHGFRTGDKLILLVCAVIPLVATEIQEAYHLPLPFLIALMVYGLIATRAFASAAENQRSAECNETKSSGMVPTERLFQHEH